MITYEMYCKIIQMNHDGLRLSQIAHKLNLNERTVRHWLNQSCYRQRKSGIRASKLDPYKQQIIQLLETYPYTGTQIFQRLKEQGYEGGVTILRDYIQIVRPRKQNAFLTLSFSPGECAQVDWGQYGTIPVGSTNRKLSFFIMVLCHSRMLYVEFTLLEKMEHFLTCHQNAFRFFGGVPEAIMVDNLKCAVLKRLVGESPVFNPRYLDFANHYGYEIRACGVAKGNEKGRVENAVGYVKKNFLAGLDIPCFTALQTGVQNWLDCIANVRIHGTIHKRPCDVFESEKPLLRRLPDTTFDCGTVLPVRANNRFRITVDSNTYSVPAEYASIHLTLKAYPDRICVYHNEKLIAEQTRHYNRHQDYENPDHPKELLLYRTKAREQKLFKRFLSLSPKAEEYYHKLSEKRLNPRHHMRKIIALSEIYGVEKVARAIEDSFTFEAFSSEYIANIIEQRERMLPEPGALHLTRRQDLLELDMPQPDISVYEQHTNNDTETTI